MTTKPNTTQSPEPADGQGPIAIHSRTGPRSTSNNSPNSSWDARKKPRPTQTRIAAPDAVKAQHVTPSAAKPKRSSQRHVRSAKQSPTALGSLVTQRNATISRIFPVGPATTGATDFAFQASPSARISSPKSAGARGPERLPRGAEHERLASIQPHTSLIDMDWDVVTGAAISAPVGRESVASFFHSVPAPLAQRRAVDTLPGLGPALTPSQMRFLKDAESIRVTSFQDYPAPDTTANSSPDTGNLRRKSWLLVALTVVAAFGLSFGARFGISRAINLTEQAQSAELRPGPSSEQQALPAQGALLAVASPPVEPPAEASTLEPESPRTAPESEISGRRLVGAVPATPTERVPRAVRVWRTPAAHLQNRPHAMLSDNPY